MHSADNAGPNLICRLCRALVQGDNLHELSKPRKRYCMKCLFSEEKKKYISKCRLLKFVPSMLSVNEYRDQTWFFMH